MCGPRGLATAAAARRSEPALCALRCLGSALLFLFGLPSFLYCLQQATTFSPRSFFICSQLVASTPSPSLCRKELQRRELAKLKHLHQAEPSFAASA